MEGFRGNPVFLSQARQNSTTHQERQEATQGAGLVLQKNKHFKSGCCRGGMPFSTVLNLKVTSFKWMSDIYFAVLQKFQNRRQTLKAVVLYIKEVSVLQGGNSYFLITQQGNNSFCVKYHKRFSL